MLRSLALAFALSLGTSFAAAQSITSFGPGDELTFVRDVVPAPGGGLYVAGRTLGRFTPGETTGLPGDAFVVRLDAAGQIVWARQWGDRRHQAATALALDGDELLVAVAENGNGDRLFRGVPAYGTAILRLGSDGSERGHFPVDALVHDIALGSGGRVAVCGRKVELQRGTVDFHLAVHERDGRRRWLHTERSRRSDESCRAVAWRGERVVASGWVSAPRGEVPRTRLTRAASVHDDAQLGVEPMSRPMLTAAFDARRGRRLWARVWRGGDHRPHGLDVGADGTVWVAAQVDRTWTAPNRWNASLVAYGPDGRHLHTTHREVGDQARGFDAVQARDDGALWMISPRFGYMNPRQTALGIPAANRIGLIAVSRDGRARLVGESEAFRRAGGFALVGGQAQLVGVGCVGQRCSALVERWPLATAAEPTAKE
ncbi:MAG TPA: hypothetical protein RMH85_21195 [Polyangiaceae bacterium LLY-WYZ-15_(1-7)]|nr:hypothetical protein [Sandaracinus sp.]HJL00412.1 hypothetical protein [Polyangiaceae bacterium LLY-WYZ-15_(1-7)]HJL11005.1 hypothetical protein [Polyangiaceae bacterium LLY-WYZ-15_(1-7)]